MKDFLQDIIEETYGIKDIIKPDIIKEIPQNIPIKKEAISSNIAKQDVPKYLEILRRKVEVCTNCMLHTYRKNIVFGEGNINAKLMFIGEGPGEEEDKTGRPFVGAAGQLLTKMIEAMGLKRDDVYIANIVKCRPPNNRNPYEDEASKCIIYLKEQIELIKPTYIICLGSVASKYLFSEEIKITKERGSWRLYNGVNVMLTYHPSFLLRSPEKKRETWKDLQEVMKKMGLDKNKS